MRRKRAILAAAVGLCAAAGGVVAWTAGREPAPPAEVDTSGIGTAAYRDVQRLGAAVAERDLTDDEVERAFALVGSPDGYTVRARACTVLLFVKRAEWRERVVNRLAAALDDPERVVVMCACDALAAQGAREQTGRVASLLLRGDGYISTAAARSLAKLQPTP